MKLNSKHDTTQRRNEEEKSKKKLGIFIDF